MNDYNDAGHDDGRCDTERRAEAEEDAASRLRFVQFLHPDCRDPAHPGCYLCGVEDE